MAGVFGTYGCRNRPHHDGIDHDVNRLEVARSSTEEGPSPFFFSRSEHKRVFPLFLSLYSVGGSIIPIQ